MPLDKLNRTNNSEVVNYVLRLISVNHNNLNNLLIFIGRKCALWEFREGFITLAILTVATLAKLF